MSRDRFGRETIGSGAEEWRAEGNEVQIDGDESDPDFVVILPKKEETEEHE